MANITLFTLDRHETALRSEVPKKLLAAIDLLFAYREVYNDVFHQYGKQVISQPTPAYSQMTWAPEV